MRLLVSIVVLLLLAACGGGASDPGSRPPGTTETETKTETLPVEPIDVVPAFPVSGRRQSAKSHGDGTLVFSDIRVAERRGFDRVVLEFLGAGRPGWSVQYVDEPALEGSGRVIRLRGDSALDISASGNTWPGSGYYDGPRRVVAKGGGAEVYVGGTFEGYTQVIAGIDGDPVPFRVFALADPARLVVDVRKRDD